jgi:hypothetical protein
MKELDKIKILEHFNFELLLEGSDLGWSFGNCWSLGKKIYIELGRKSC